MLVCNLISTLLLLSAFGNTASFHAPRDLRVRAHCQLWSPRTPPPHTNVSTRGAVPSTLDDTDRKGIRTTSSANRTIRRTVAIRLRRIIPSWIRIYYKRATRNHHRQATNRERGMTGSFQDWAHSKLGIKFVVAYCVGYLALSVAAFSCLLEPSWTVIDSLYFAVATFTTVGYGDLSPTTTAGKVFTIFFSLYGISILGIALGIIGTNISEVQETAMKEVRHLASKRLVTLFDELPQGEKNTSSNTEHRSGQEMPSVSSSLTPSYLAQLSTNNASSENLGTAIAASEHDPEEDRHIAHQISSILISQLPILSTILTIAVCLGKKYEGWSTLTSVYYCWITLTTVGYGDFTPKSQQMRLFAVVFLPLWVAVDGEIIGRIAGAFVGRQEKRAERLFLARELTAHDLLVMDTHGTGDVSFDEFLSYVLVAMHKVDQETIDELRAVFESRDMNGSGTIMREDLVLMARKRREHLRSKSDL